MNITAASMLPLGAEGSQYMGLQTPRPWKATITMDLIGRAEERVRFKDVIQMPRDDTNICLYEYYLHFFDSALLPGSDIPDFLFHSIIVE